MDPERRSIGTYGTLAAGALTLAALALLFRFTPWKPDASVPDTVTESSRSAPETRAAKPTLDAPTPTLSSGETLEIDGLALDPGRPLVLHLDLEVPAAAAETLSGRIVTAGRDPLPLTGAVQDGDLRRATIEIDPTWLEPGRYIIELKTSERTHFPLRRYVLEVR